MADRYSITERVDAGGMAEVFRGVAESLQGFKKNVAIKRILPSLAKNEKFVSMFLDEAKLSLYLQHANIVQVFDIGQSENSYFLVMEFVNGCNLKTIIEHYNKTGKRFEVNVAIYLMLECCKALNYAHHMENPENGEPLHIVHRDISPPNILISKMGEVKVVDFGLAKANSQIESTDPGIVKGKFSYLSPEAASGQMVDKRTDIFALGIILWEMLTGERLFYGDSDYQTVELVRRAHIPSISAINPKVEKELEDIVNTALARKPDQRYSEAADFSDALAQYLFSRSMKVTARDIAKMVNTVRSKENKSKPKPLGNSLIDALIRDEMGKMTSLIDCEEPARGVSQMVGAQSLDPDTFIGEEAWDPSNNMSRSHAEDLTPLPLPVPPADTPVEDLDSLQQMLEPDKTIKSPAKSPEKSFPKWLVLVAIALLGAIGLTLWLLSTSTPNQPLPF